MLSNDIWFVLKKNKREKIKFNIINRVIPRRFIFALLRFVLYINVAAAFRP
jgi:hypothetical protein